MYSRPKTLDAAVHVLAQDGGQILSGGTDFFPALGDRPAPDRVVDISGLAEIKGVLVLAVPAGSLAQRSGLRANDVILEAAASGYSRTEVIDNLATLMILYSAERWLGQRSFLVVRDQQPIQLTLKFQAE